MIRFTFDEKHDHILKGRAERKKASDEKKRKDAIAKKQREERIERMTRVTVVVQAAGYCKRAPASLNQAKTYLKKEKFYKKSEVEHLTEESVVENFLKWFRAYGRAVIAEMKKEASKVKLKKPRKRKRVEKNPIRKKLRDKFFETEEERD